MSIENLWGALGSCSNPNLCRLRWNMTIYTDRKLQNNRPDITLVRKETQGLTLIDIAAQADQNVIKTKHEKDLAFEI